MVTFIGKIGRAWFKFAEIFGNIQMIVLLSLIYWILFPLVAIPFRLFADPLNLKRRGQARWIDRQPVSKILESMRKQG